MPDIQINRIELGRLRRHIPAARRYYVGNRFPDNTNGYGVAGNTFRSFDGYEERFGQRPSDVFKTWAAAEFLRLCAGPALGEKAAYRRWDTMRMQRLDAAFQILLEAHRRHKLADLFTKWCARHPAVPGAVRRALVRHGNCPIDSKSLVALGRLAPGTVLNANPSMGAIASEEAYHYVQAVIAEACTHIGCTPLQFDAIAWRPAPARRGR